MATLADILGGSSDDIRQKQEAEDFVKNLKQTQLGTPRSESLLGIISGGTTAGRMQHATNLSDTKRRVQQGMGTGPFKTQALMQQALQKVKEKGLSPTNNKEAWLKAMSEETSRHPELMKQSLGFSEAHDALKIQQAKADLERAALGLEEREVDIKAATEIRKGLNDRLTRLKTELEIENIPKEREQVQAEIDKTLAEIERLDRLTPAKVDAERALAEERRTAAALNQASLDAGLPQAEVEDKRAQAAARGTTTATTPTTKAVSALNLAVANDDWLTAIPLATDVAAKEYGKPDDMVYSRSRAQDAQALNATFSDLNGVIVNPTGGVKELRENLSNVLSTLSTEEEGVINELIGTIRGPLDPSTPQRTQDTALRLTAIELARFLSSSGRADRRGSISNSHLREAKRILGVDQFTGSSREDLFASIDNARKYVNTKHKDLISRSARPKMDVLRRASQIAGVKFKAVWSEEDGGFQIYKDDQKIPEGIIR